MTIENGLYKFIIINWRSTTNRPASVDVSKSALAVNQNFVINNFEPKYRKQILTQNAKSIFIHINYVHLKTFPLSYLD